MLLNPRQVKQANDQARHWEYQIVIDGETLTFWSESDGKGAWYIDAAGSFRKVSRAVARSKQMSERLIQPAPTDSTNTRTDHA